jgi:SPOR domain
MSEIFNIQMSRGRVITVVGCLILAGVLLFAAGTVAGLLMASASVQSLSAAAQLPETKPAVKHARITSEPAAPVPSDSALAAGAEASAETMAAADRATAPASQTATSAVSSPQPAPSPAPALTVSAPPSAAVAATRPPAAASSGTAPNAGKESASGAASATAEPAADSSYAIPLAVKVCSFTGKTSAEAMIASLASKGYRASLGHSSGTGGRTWYVVKLGPYKEWNTASDVAARVAIAENVRPVIGPVK